jgi:hypothetical protein
MRVFGRSGNVGTFTATVTAAGAPPQNVIARHYGDWVFVVADLGDGPTLVRSVVPLDRDRWLVPGMQVPIEIDPSKTDSIHAFTIDWDGVPTIEDRVAANDPTLADPRAARRRARELQTSARDAAHAPSGLLSRLDQPAFGMGARTIAPSSGFSTDTSSWSAGFDAAVEQARSLPATPGMCRAVVTLAAMRMVFRNIGHHLDGTPDLVGEANHSTFESAITGNETVLAVTVPGQSPYAVFDKGFKAPRGKPVTRTPNLYPYLPAMVSLTDPQAVEIVWDEVPSQMEQVEEKIDTALDAAAARQQSIVDTYTQALSDPTPPPPGAPTTAEELHAIKDPMQRAAAMAAFIGHAQAAAFAASPAAPTGPVDADAGLKAMAKQNAARVAAASGGQRRQLIKSLKMGMSMMDNETSAKLRDLMRAEGVDI